MYQETETLHVEHLGSESVQESVHKPRQWFYSKTARRFRLTVFHAHLGKYLGRHPRAKAFKAPRTQAYDTRGNSPPLLPGRYIIYGYHDFRRAACCLEAHRPG